MGLLELRLERVPGVLGIYGETKDLFPVRMSFLHPEAAAAFRAAQTKGRIRVSDMYRSAEESLRARAQKQGVQPPGYSAHNYGLAIDVDVDDCLKTFGMEKKAFDAMMETFGWYCHRWDSKRGFEDWHYNYLGKNPSKYVAGAVKRTRDAAIEAYIADLFGDQLQLTSEEAQIALAKLKMYRGEIDGIFGGGSRQALMAFQRAWKLPATGELDDRTQRTLAYVSADVIEVKQAVV